MRLIKSNWKAILRHERNYPQIAKKSSQIGPLPLSTPVNAATPTPLVIAVNVAAIIATEKKKRGNMPSGLSEASKHKVNEEKKSGKTSDGASGSINMQTRTGKDLLPLFDSPSTSQQAADVTKSTAVKRVRSTEEPQPAAKKQQPTSSFFPINL